MAGFFPVMIFGLPAACLAMYRAALPTRRKEVAGMLVSLALTSALTGVTEPIEFSFMFLAPALYAVHAVLTGLAMVLMDLLGVKLGFGFSAGLLDYVLNYGRATRPLLLLPVGALYFGLYYGIFAFAIRRFDLKTPGRDTELEPVRAVAAPSGDRGEAFINALGGSANLTSVNACTTRLRLMVVDHAEVDEAMLKALGARGLIRPSTNALQVVLGPIADLVAMEIRDALALGGSHLAAPAAVAPGEGAGLASSTLAALGGADNVRNATVHGTRLRVELEDSAKAADAALTALGIRSVARPALGVVHLLVAPGAIAGLLAR